MRVICHSEEGETRRRIYFFVVPSQSEATNRARPKRFFGRTLSERSDQPGPDRKDSLAGRSGGWEHVGALFLGSWRPGPSPGHKRRMPDVKRRLAFQRTAATYSPTWWGSTIGDGELNFSVRNGKRWFLTAITAAIYYLREQTSRRLTARYSIDHRFWRSISICMYLSSARKSLGQLVQVC